MLYVRTVADGRGVRPGIGRVRFPAHELFRTSRHQTRAVHCPEGRYGYCASERAMGCLPSPDLGEGRLLGFGTILQELEPALHVPAVLALASQGADGPDARPA